MPRRPILRLRRPTLDFLRTEAASGAILGGTALLAILLANSPWQALYFDWLRRPFTVQVGGFEETLSTLRWVKEGLMALFFFIVGLELKFEALKGELSNPRKLALPVLAAIGGMVVPAGIYLLVNAGPGGQPNGWPTPTATDIAFALAALAVVGRSLPPSLRVFLMTLAIVDDLGAVLLIALLFSTEINLPALAGVGASLGVLALLSRWRSAPVSFYVVVLIAVWAFTLKSGVSTSLGAVAAALLIPVPPRREGQPGLLHSFMHGLHPYVAYGVLPLFAFVAAGFTLSGVSAREAFSPAPLGIVAGLFLGKQLGVFGAAWLAIRSGLARRPTGATWSELYGVAILCGVGFTMSLYIGGLAFPAADPVAQAEVRLGVIAGSLLSVLAGSVLVAWSARRRAALAIEAENGAG